MTEISIDRFEKWEQLFESLSVPEIQALEKEATEKAHSKKSELRLLIGAHFRTLLQTADDVSKIKDGANNARLELNQLIKFDTVDKWKREAENVVNFSDFTRSRVDVDSILAKSLLQTIERCLFVHWDPLCVARCFSLLDKLRGCDNSRVTDLRQIFDQELTRRIFKAPARNSTEDISEGELIALYQAYALFNNTKLSTFLETYFEKRLELITITAADQSVTESLKIVHDSIFFSQLIFGSGKLSKAFSSERLSKTTMLDCLRSTENLGITINRVSTFLSRDIIESSSVSDKCLDDLAEPLSRVFRRAKSQFCQSVIIVVDHATSAAMDTTEELAALNALFFEILNLVRHSNILRSLEFENSKQLWFVHVIETHWFGAFERLIKSYLKFGDSLRETISEAVGVVSRVPSSGQGSIFAEGSIYMSTPTADLKDRVITEGINTELKNYCLGNDHNSQVVYEVLNSWAQNALELKAQITEVMILPTDAVISGYRNEYEELDSELSDNDLWNGQVSQAKLEACKKFNKSTSSLFELFHEKFTGLIGSHAKSIDNTHASAALIRISILHNKIGNQLDQDFTVVDTVDQLYEVLSMHMSAHLKSAIKNELYDDISTSLWSAHTSDHSVILPKSPSPKYLDFIYRSVAFILDIIGQDASMVMYAGFETLREQISTCIINSLEAILSLNVGDAESTEADKTKSIQLCMDLLFSEKLFGIEASTWRAVASERSISDDILSQLELSASDSAVKMRLILLPLSK